MNLAVSNRAHSRRDSNKTLSERVLFTLLVLCASSRLLSAQGYIYTFSGDSGSELDGSFIIITESGPGPPLLSNLSAAKILDSYGSIAVFDILAPPNSVTSFAVKSFGPIGFSGEITCEMFGNLGSPSVVVLSGNPAAISYSSNLFFPGNPAGGSITGNWAVAAIPEPRSFLLIFLGFAVLYGYRLKPVKGHSSLIGDRRAL